VIIRLLSNRPSRSGVVKDYEFSQATIGEAWTAGLEDVRRSISGWDKVQPGKAAGVLVYRPTEPLPAPRHVPVRTLPAPRQAAMRRNLKSESRRSQ
jgi:hypothetical protein